MFDAYLLIDGVPGECTAKGYEDQIQIESFNHGVSQSANLSASTAGGATTGRCTHNDFCVTKELDKASALLAQYCSAGKHIPSVKLALVRSGGDGPVEYMEYKLTRCIVSSISTSGSGTGDAGSIPTEVLSFNYAAIEWTYTQTSIDDGGKGGVTTGMWNLMTNEPKL